MLNLKTLYLFEISSQASVFFRKCNNTLISFLNVSNAFFVLFLAIIDFNKISFWLLQTNLNYWILNIVRYLNTLVCGRKQPQTVTYLSTSGGLPPCYRGGLGVHAPSPPALCSARTHMRLWVDLGLLKGARLAIAPARPVRAPFSPSLERTRDPSDHEWIENSARDHLWLSR